MWLNQDESVILMTISRLYMVPDKFTGLNPHKSYHWAKWLGMKSMRWDSFMGCIHATVPTHVLREHPQISPNSFLICVQSVAYRVKNHKPWECKKMMQVSFKWLTEPHEIGVWHLQRANTMLYSWDRKSTKTWLSDNSYLICTEYTHPLYAGSTSHNAHLTRVETQLNWSTYVILACIKSPFPDSNLQWRNPIPIQSPLV